MNSKLDKFETLDIFANEVLGGSSVDPEAARSTRLLAEKSFPPAFSEVESMQVQSNDENKQEDGILGKEEFFGFSEGEQKKEPRQPSSKGRDTVMGSSFAGRVKLTEPPQKARRIDLIDIIDDSESAFREVLSMNNPRDDVIQRMTHTSSSANTKPITTPKLAVTRVESAKSLSPFVCHKESITETQESVSFQIKTIQSETTEPKESKISDSAVSEIRKLPQFPKRQERKVKMRVYSFKEQEWHSTGRNSGLFSLDLTQSHDTAEVTRTEVIAEANRQEYSSDSVVTNNDLNKDKDGKMKAVKQGNEKTNKNTQESSNMNSLPKNCEGSANDTPVKSIKDNYWDPSRYSFIFSNK